MTGEACTLHRGRKTRREFLAAADSGQTEARAGEEDHSSRIPAGQHRHRAHLDRAHAVGLEDGQTGRRNLGDQYARNVHSVEVHREGLTIVVPKENL